MKYDLLREWTFIREAPRKDDPNAPDKPFYPMKGVTPLNTALNPAQPEEKVAGVKWELKLSQLNEPVKTMMMDWATQLAKLKQQDKIIKDIKPNLEQAGYDMAGTIFGKNIIHPMYIRVETNTNEFLDVMLAKQEKKEKVAKVDTDRALKALLSMGKITQEVYDTVIEAYTTMEDARPSPKSIDITLPKTETVNGILVMLSKLGNWVMTKFDIFKSKDQEFHNSLKKI